MLTGPQAGYLDMVSSPTSSMEDWNAAKEPILEYCDILGVRAMGTTSTVTTRGLSVLRPLNSVHRNKVPNSVRLNPTLSSMQFLSLQLLHI